MAAVRKPDVKELFADKRALRNFIAEQNALIGFVKDPTATAEEAREMILADGVRPEGNLFSRGIIEARAE